MIYLSCRKKGREVRDRARVMGCQHIDRSIFKSKNTDVCEGREKDSPDVRKPNRGACVMINGFLTTTALFYGENRGESEGGDGMIGESRVL